MSVTIGIQISTTADRLINRFGATAELGQKMATTMDLVNQETVQRVKSKLRGPVLNYRTGGLHDSIGRTRVDVRGKGSDVEVLSSIGSNVQFSGGKSIRYAAIHEYGGHIPERVPINARALRFFVGGREVYAMRAKAFDMPQRSYLRSTVNERKGVYARRMSRTIIRHFRGEQPSA